MVLITTSSLVYILPTTSTFHAAGSGTGAPLTRAGNNTTINQPPQIITESLPPLEKGMHYSVEIEAEDDTTPAGFLTWSLSYDSDYFDDMLVMYMEGNILKAEPALDIRSDIEVTITVQDDEGASGERIFKIDVDWTNEPPVILHYPERITITDSGVYLSVGKSNSSDIQYVEAEDEGIEIEENSISKSWCYTYYYSEGRLRISRRSDDWGTVTLDLFMEDDFGNKVDFTIIVEFLSYESFGLKTFHIMELSGNEVYRDDTMLVFGVGMEGVEGPLFHNITVLSWEVNGTEFEDYVDMFKVILPAGSYNISVTFHSYEITKLDHFTIWKHIEVEPSGMQDINKKEETQEDSLGTELCLLGIVVPSLILLPMVAFYLFFFMRRRMREGGDEE